MMLPAHLIYDIVHDIAPNVLAKLCKASIHMTKTIKSSLYPYCILKFDFNNSDSIKSKYLLYSKLIYRLGGILSTNSYYLALRGKKIKPKVPQTLLTYSSPRPSKLSQPIPKPLVLAVSTPYKGFKWLQTTGFKFEYEQYFAICGLAGNAARQGDLNKIKLIINCQKNNSKPGNAYYGNPDLCLINLIWEVYYYAAFRGHIKICKWLYSEGHSPSDRIYEPASCGGSIEILKWALSLGIPCQYERWLKLAINMHQQEVIEWIHINYHDQETINIE